MKQKLLRYFALLLLLSPMLQVALAQEVVNESRQVSANEKIYIEVMRGEVEIRTSSGPNFNVTGTLDEVAEGYELSSENGFTRFVVRMPRTLSFGRSSNQRGSELDFEIPRGSNVEVRVVNASIDIADVTGGVSLNSVNGSIQAERLSDFVKISTVNGSIGSVDNNGRIELSTVNGSIDDRQSSGRISYSAVNGRINIDSQAEEIHLSVVNGRVAADLQSTTDLELSSVNGDIEVNLQDSPTPRIEGSTVSGDIRLNLDANVSARFSLRSNAGGSISNGITADESTRATYGPARRLEFTTGEGEGVVELTSISGRLELRNN